MLCRLFQSSKLQRADQVILDVKGLKKAFPVGFLGWMRTMWVCFRIRPHSDLDIRQMMIPTIGFAGPQFWDKPHVMGAWCKTISGPVAARCWWALKVRLVEHMHDLSLAGKPCYPAPDGTRAVTEKKRIDQHWSPMRGQDQLQNLVFPERPPCLKFWFKKGMCILFSQKISNDWRESLLSLPFLVFFW